jgi:uncharacterized membrane protein YfcA
LTAAGALVAAIGGFVAGAVNAVAGGGSLVSFPALVAAGLSPLQANVTNTVAIWPGYLSAAGTLGRELPDRRAVARRLLPVSVAGALAGALLLLATPEDSFDGLVPWLVFAACALLAVQPAITRRVHDRPRGTHTIRILLLGGVFVASVYGAYFGGGLGVLLLAVLGIATADPLPRANAIKAFLQLVVNTVALVVFAIGGPVVWSAVAIVAPLSLIGGWTGARIARRLHPVVLRRAVLTLGATAGVLLLVR